MTVIRIRPPMINGDPLDADGNPVAGEEVRQQLVGFLVAPRTDDSEGTGETNQRGRSGVVVGLQLFGPEDDDTGHLDRFEIDGGLYEVEGEPARWPSPWPGGPSGTVINLRRAAG